MSGRSIEPAVAMVMRALVLAALLLAPAVHVPTRAADFSEVRAAGHVRALAAAPRPVGSAANAEAREYLLRQLRALGLAPEVQTATVHTAAVDMWGNARVTLATVRNVLIRLPGTAHARPAVLAVARYDSAPASLGAADGAGSAAALLEALRVLRAGPPPANDVLFAFTDGDGAQAFGTRALVESHPWMRRVGLALRFDHAGSRGPLALIDPAQAGAAALDGWAHAAPDPRGSSFMAELLRLPQRASGAVLAGAGVPLLHFANTGGTLGPDGVWDVPSRLAPASLRRDGDTMLALLRHFGAADLATMAASPQVVVALPFAGHLRYAQSLAWPLVGLAWVLTVLCCRRAMKGLRIAGTDIVQAAFGWLCMAGLATFIAYLAWETLPGMARRWQYGLLAADPGAGWQALAFMLLPAAIFAPLQADVQRKLGARTAALGVLCMGSVALTVATWLAPGASGVLALPLLAAQAAWLADARANRPQRDGARALVPTLVPASVPFVAGCIPALLLLPPAIHDSLQFLSPARLLAPSSLACLLLGLCGPALAALHGRYARAAGGLLAAGVLGCAACAGFAYAAAPRVPPLPVVNPLVYFKDTPSWQAYWMHPAGPLDAWVRQLFPHAMSTYHLPYMLGQGSNPVWYAAAPRDDAIAYPDLLIERVEEVEDPQWGRVRHVEIRIRSRNRAPEIGLALSGAMPIRTRLDDRVLTPTIVRGWQLTLHGQEDRAMRLSLDLLGDGPFTLSVRERLPGLPDLPDHGLPARPAGMQPALLPRTGTTVAFDVLRFR
jgi:hypothetical protein